MEIRVDDDADDWLAARRMRALHRISRALAHDMNGPLNAISLHLDLLRRSIANPDAGTAAGGDLPVRQMRYAETIRSEMQTLEHAVKNLLASIRPPAAERVRFDLRSALRELGELVAAHARAQRSTLEIELPEVELPVQAHPDPLKQALLELLLHALEACPSTLRVAPTAAGDRVVLRIAATGERDGDATGEGAEGHDAIDAARAVVRRQGGDVALIRGAGGQLDVEVQMPLARDEAHP
jgi:signal transduction histidine kinase